MVGAAGDAGPEFEQDLGPGQGQRPGVHLGSDPRGHPERAVRRAGQHDNELVVAVAGKKVALPHALLEGPREMGHERIGALRPVKFPVAVELPDRQAGDRGRSAPVAGPGHEPLHGGAQVILLQDPGHGIDQVPLARRHVGQQVVRVLRGPGFRVRRGGQGPVVLAAGRIQRGRGRRQQGLHRRAVLWKGGHTNPYLEGDPFPVAPGKHIVGKRTGEPAGDPLGGVTGCLHQEPVPAGGGADQCVPGAYTGPQVLGHKGAQPSPLRL